MKVSTTPCGKITEHAQHLYQTRKGVKVCDGRIYEDKRKRRKDK